MPQRAARACPRHGLHRGGRCTKCRRDRQRRHDAQRPSAADRGYGAKWHANSKAFLAANPNCRDCGRPATQADHAPVSRRQLVAEGIPNPDAWSHLEPRCHACHSRRTATHDGGFGHSA